MKLRLLAALFATVIKLLSITANAAVLPLEGRLPATPGGTDYQAYYDPNLNICWMADAGRTGAVDWYTANAWVAGLTIGGVSGWRLPNMDVNGDGNVVACHIGGVTGCEDNELGFLYREEGITYFTPSPYTNVLSGPYWSSTEWPSDPFFIWTFDFYQGTILPYARDYTFMVSAWAVHDGDVRPIPAAVWLFASGLIGLVGIARRRKQS